MKQEERNYLTKTIRKSTMNAADDYDYKKLVNPSEHLLALQIEEKKEELTAVYDITGCLLCTEIRKDSRQNRLRMLLDAVKLYSLRQEYSFSIAPENIYYDRNYRVYVMDRDTYLRGEADKSDFVEEYKALTGYVMQKRYSFEDYLSGGADLYVKNQFLKPFMQFNTLEEITDYLETEYEAVTKDIQENCQLVNKSSHRISFLYIIISIVLLLAGAGYISYYTLNEKPTLRAKLAAEADFIKNDYIKVVDDLKKLPMDKLGYEQKYILSTAYVKTESLTVEQKENIIKTLPVNGDENLMEYWIHIGRRNAVEAENIAMQRSDDELLLYAYMQEKDITETDTEMTGEEKSARLEVLEGKIRELSDKYLTEEE